MARRTRRHRPPTTSRSTSSTSTSATRCASSFLEYAYSVIYSRALPDARDGLKPVQRRILYTMNDMGLRPDRGHVKSARVVGEVMGRLHPHGDGAIYDALVRLAQPWSMRLPMVDGHGNFGSPRRRPRPRCATPSAGWRRAAVAMTASIDEDTVDFKPNYDSRELEPIVLPGGDPQPGRQRHHRHRGRHGHQHGPAQPGRGGPGAAAPDHAPRRRPRRPDALHPRPRPAHRRQDRRPRRHPRRLRDRPRHLPDAGHRPGRDGRPPQGHRRHRAAVRRRHREGRRADQDARAGQEAAGHRRRQGPHRPATTACAWSSRSRTASSPRRCSSSSTGRRRWRTPSASTTSALVDGQPRTLGLKELLEVFLEHRYDVVRRRSQFRRDKKADRLHLVDGLLIAILDIDEVIQVIRTSDDAAAARERLMIVFDLTEAQADYILDMPLRRLTRFSRIELEKEQETLRREIEELDAILADEALLRRRSSPTSSPRSPRPTARRGAPCCSSRPARPSPPPAAPLEVADDPCFALPLLQRAARPHRRSDEPPGARRRPRQPRRRRLGGAAPPRAARSACSPSRGRLVKLGVLDLPALPAVGQRPQPRRAAARSARCSRSSRASGRWR